MEIIFRWWINISFIISLIKLYLIVSLDQFCFFCSILFLFFISFLNCSYSFKLREKKKRYSRFLHNISCSKVGLKIVVLPSIAEFSLSAWRVGSTAARECIINYLFVNCSVKSEIFNVPVILITMNLICLNFQFCYSVTTRKMLCQTLH